ncbi:uncharacterized protein LOC132282031 [Cornus florida]|uniref:uncharacterized protein LOC132282031 n=1 Tax=Cornus florida TaxID=4283 RepID=UPI00289C0BE1|nr:uncharacterized protein LOC132282031 [Cornus florida]
MKAFDSVGWEFLLNSLILFGFPSLFLGWIKACITSPAFTISVNGEFQGIFLGCRNLAISHLIFADDLLLFSHGDLGSISTLKNAIDNFAALSGLSINHSKSNFFIAGINNIQVESIKNLLGFECGILPFKYLGVPLVSSSLKSADCRGLVEKVTRRINHWSSKFLSYAGRLQLIQSVLYSIFTGAKNNWPAVCQPKSCGGLGFKNLEIANRAACLKHIWTIISTDRKNL